MTALLETLKYVNFVRDGDDASGVTEARTGGMPRYNGDASRLSEYAWRVRARATKESFLDDTEKKKHGPLALRLCEALSGPALRVAQGIDTKLLAKKEGHEELLKALFAAFKPRREQEARELYSAGSREGGILSRQQGEPMSTYILRRKAW